jgi:hypothetical protein
MHKSFIIGSILILVISVTAMIFSLQVHTAMAAPLITPLSEPTSNIVNTKASYEILFTTATTGTIKTITVAYPAGFSVGAAKLVERIGIGAGTLSASGTVLTYTVSSPVSIPAGIPIRLEFANIIHPGIPGAFPVTITTKGTFNIIDGPTSSTTSIAQIGTAANLTKLSERINWLMGQ